MADSIDKYGLDLHSSMILEEYREALPVFQKMLGVVRSALEKSIRDYGLYVTAIETRIKQEKSLAGKLELKGAKYRSLADITDILGARVITFYSDEVDKISAIVDRIFDIDWEHSVDKRKMHELDSFGYNSLHYVCRIPKSLYSDAEMPQLNEFEFEIQMRTALQHVWATLDHDTGYKSGVEIPKEYLRNLNRLAGMLELADEQFSLIRLNINDYRRRVQSLVSSGKFDEVPLTLDSFKRYLQLKPFDKLTRKIAALNQAEVHETTAIPYLEVFRHLGFKSLGDLDSFIRANSDDAYELAVYQIGNTDLDIIASTISIQDLCVVHILKNGGGAEGLQKMFDLLGGTPESNKARAERLTETASQLVFMNRPGHGKQIS